MDLLWKRWYFYTKMIWNNTPSSCSSSKMRLRRTALLTVNILSFHNKTSPPLHFTLLSWTQLGQIIIWFWQVSGPLGWTRLTSLHWAPIGLQLLLGPQSPDLKLFKQNDSAGVVHSVWTWTEMTSGHWSFRLTQNTHLVKLAAGLTRSVSTDNCAVCICLMFHCHTQTSLWHWRVFVMYGCIHNDYTDFWAAVCHLCAVTGRVANRYGF